MIVVFVVALTVYLRTVAPTLTWGHHGSDGGDLVTAVVTKGVPHPTGYPTYALLGQIFVRIPWGDTAYRLNLMSAFFAAITVALVYLILLSTFRLFHDARPGLPERLSAAAAALALAFSPLFWSQALIAEVYALNACFVSLIVYLVLWWIEEPNGTTLGLIALTAGLGAGNHLTILLLLPALPILMWMRRGHLPDTVWRGATVALLFLLGLTVYAYLPLAAARHPPVNWGDPSSVRGFFWTVSGRLYQPYLFGLPLRHLPARLAAWSGLLVEQFRWWGFILSLVGCWSLWRRARKMALFSLFLILGYSAYAIGYDTADSQVNLIPAVLLLSLWLGWGLAFVLREMDRQLRSRTRWSWTLSLGAALLIPLLSLVGNFRSMDLSGDTEARDYGESVLKELEPNAILISETDRHTFTLWYARYAERWRTDIAVLDADLLHFAWYRANARRVHPDIDLRDADAPSVASQCNRCSPLTPLIERNWDVRPIYVTDPDPRLKERYQLTQQGHVYRVLGARES